MTDLLVNALVSYFTNLSLWDALNSFLIGFIFVFFSIMFGSAIKDLSTIADMTFKIWPFKRRVNPAYVFGELLFRLGCGLMIYSLIVIVFLLLKIAFPI